MFSTIVLAISPSQLYLITLNDRLKPAWDALCNHFERDTLANKPLLKKQYFRLEMNEGTSVEAHMKRIKELTDKVSALGAPIAMLLMETEVLYMWTNRTSSTRLSQETTRAQS